MKRATEARLLRLEAKLGAYKRRPHVIEGYDDEQRQAYREALIRTGRADPRDVFVVTGVMRGRNSWIQSNEPLS
jgi:hypothetical protein